MRKPAFYMKAALVVGLSVMIACVKDSPTPEPPRPQPEAFIPDPLTVDDARALFSEYGDDYLYYPGPGPETRSEDGSLIEPDWENAKTSTLVGYDVVEIPVKELAAALYGEEEVPEDFLGVNESEFFEPNTSVRVVAGLDGWNEPYLRTLYIKPDSCFLETVCKIAEELELDDIVENFSGQLHLHYPDGDFALGYVLNEGTLVSVLYQPGEEPERFTSGGEGAPTTRGEVCTTYQYWYLVRLRSWSDDYASYDLFEWRSTTYIDCYDDGGGATPNPGEGEGGGGGNGNTGGGSGNGEEGPVEKELLEPCEYCGKTVCVCPKCEKCKRRKPCDCKEVCIQCGQEECVCAETPDPCENLKKKAADMSFMAKLDHLSDYTADDTGQELGYTFEFDRYDGYVFSEILFGSTTEQSVNFSESSQKKWDGVMHSHFPEAGKMFSFYDLAIHGDAVKSHKAKSPFSFASGLVTPKGTYFLMMDNWYNYQKFYNRTFDRNMNELTASTDFTDMKANNDINAFLYFLNSFNTGLTLMVYDEVSRSFKKAQYISLSMHKLEPCLELILEL